MRREETGGRSHFGGTLCPWEVMRKAPSSSPPQLPSEPSRQGSGPWPLGRARRDGAVWKTPRAQGSPVIRKDKS